MSGPPHQLPVPGRRVLNAVRAALTAREAWIAEPAESFRRLTLDSFDWRLYRRNEVLEWEESGAGGRLLWYSRDRATPAIRLTRPAPPRFPAELPPGPLQRVLAPTLEMRALLPQAEVRGRLWRLRCVDAHGKTILRLQLEHYRRGEGSFPAGGAALRVEPMRGYRRIEREVLAWLEAEFGLRPKPVHPLENLLAASDRHPGDYSSRLQVRLEPEMAAGDAVRTLLLELLATLERNEAGTRADLDSEFLHDFRVSVRRTRTAIGQLKSVFPQTPLARFRRGFAWLGEVTSPTRDLDVYLLGFEDYRSALPEELRGHLGPLHDFLVRHQQLEQRRLARTLETQRYRRLIEAWRTFLSDPPATRRPPVDAGRTVLAVASERTWRMFRRVVREGLAITPDSPATDLHELRKSCKKLRYLLEFFQSLYPAAEMRLLIRALKGLQDHLGEFQDLEVQSLTLARFAAEMQAEGAVPEATLRAMDYLVQDLHARQQHSRATFADHFAAFSAKPNRQLFRCLFRRPALQETP